MKTYILTEGELSELATLQGTATVSFSLGSAFCGAAFSVMLSLALAVGVQADISQAWAVVKWGLFVASATAFAVGAVFFFKGRSRLAKIKEEMEHA